MPLTDTTIKNLAPRAKTFKLADGGGLYLQITPAGSKLWRMKYRFNKREKLLAFGAYPLVSLKLARAKRDDAKLLLSDGKDPSQERRNRKRQAEQEAGNSFNHLAQEYLGKLAKEGRAEMTLKKTRWLLDFAAQDLGKIETSQITSRDVLAVIRKMERDGKHESAARLRSTIGSVVRYAIATGRAETDPTLALKGALIRVRATPRAAILEPKKLGALLRTIDNFQGQPGTRVALQLLALLAPRPGELRLSSWHEFDLEAAIWNIPAERTKMRRLHKTPLPRQAIALLQDYARLRSTETYLLPSTHSLKKTISENTLNAALRRMGYGSDQVTSHGFRASFSTLANESGLWHADAIERALGHVEGNEVRAAYARGAHWDERTRIAQWWADELDRFREMAAQ